MPRKHAAKLFLFSIVAALSSSALFAQGRDTSDPGDESPFTVRVMRDGATSEIRISAINDTKLSASAFALMIRNFPGAGGLTKYHLWVACKKHLPAIKPGEAHIYYFGTGPEFEMARVSFAAAMYTDGTSWGKPDVIAKLQSEAKKCTGPTF